MPRNYGTRNAVLRRMVRNEGYFTSIIANLQRNIETYDGRDPQIERLLKTLKKRAEVDRLIYEDIRLKRL